MRFAPAWVRSYRRDWLPRDVIAGVIVGSVADRVRAHRDLTHARRERDDRDLPLSAAAVGPLVNGDVDRFAALSAMLAIVAGAVLVISGFLRLGGLMDLISKPVMTGFLFGLGMFVALSQLPRIFGVPAGSGNFFPTVGPAHAAGSHHRCGPIVHLADPASQPAAGRPAGARSGERGLGNAERHPDWVSTPEVLVVRDDGPLFYANAVNVKEHVIDLASAADPKLRTLILDLAGNHDLDVETLDTLGELEDALAADSIELRLGGVPASALLLLERSGLVSRLRIEPTLDAAVPS